LRQEFFSMQLIRMVGDIYTEMNLPLWIHPYDIIMFSRDEGFIEFLPNTMTISSLKKFGNLSQIYRQIYGDKYEMAITNFTKSLAGYSLICYLFQIKDRHNGNLLIDSEGHIIHIDFSFILSKCPGNIQFERAPFKLTQ
jgi:phosphatidylinositol kinase/protein kinase (PI-3  family)